MRRSSSSMMVTMAVIMILLSLYATSAATVQQRLTFSSPPPVLNTDARYTTVHGALPAEPSPVSRMRSSMLPLPSSSSLSSSSSSRPSSAPFQVQADTISAGGNFSSTDNYFYLASCLLGLDVYGDAAYRVMDFSVTGYGSYDIYFSSGAVCSSPNTGSFTAIQQYSCLSPSTSCIKSGIYVGPGSSSGVPYCIVGKCYQASCQVAFQRTCSDVVATVIQSTASGSTIPAGTSSPVTMLNSLCGPMFLAQLLTSSNGIVSDMIVNLTGVTLPSNNQWSFNFAIPSTTTVGVGYKYRLFPYDGANNTNNQYLQIPPCISYSDVFAISAVGSQPTVSSSTAGASSNTTSSSDTKSAIEWIGQWGVWGWVVLGAVILLIIVIICCCCRSSSKTSSSSTTNNNGRLNSVVPAPTATARGTRRGTSTSVNNNPNNNGRPSSQQYGGGPAPIYPQMQQPGSSDGNGGYARTGSSMGMNGNNQWDQLPPPQRSGTGYGNGNGYDDGFNGSNNNGGYNNGGYNNGNGGGGGYGNNGGNGNGGYGAPGSGYNGNGTASMRNTGGFDNNYPALPPPKRTVMVPGY